MRVAVTSGARKARTSSESGVPLIASSGGGARQSVMQGGDLSEGVSHTQTVVREVMLTEPGEAFRAVSSPEPDATGWYVRSSSSNSRAGLRDSKSGIMQRKRSANDLPARTN